MMRQYLLTLILFLAVCLAPPAALCRKNSILPEYEQPTGHPDLDLYYQQIKKNAHEAIDKRRRYLLKTTPAEHFMTDYMERGFEVIGDTVSLFELFDDFYSTSKQQQATSVLLYKVARKYNSQKLKLMADFLHGRIMSNDSLSFEVKTAWFEKLIRDARKNNDKYMEAYAMKEMQFNSYYSQRQSISFAYAQRLAETLDRIDDSYPFKGTDYLWLGIAHYSYKDYDRALRFLHKGLSYRGNKSSRAYVRACLTAWSYLADYYHTIGDSDSAALYNRTIIASPESLIDHPIHSSIAICNLGKVEMEKGRYDEAIALIQAGLVYIKGDSQGWDFEYGVYIVLGECLLAKGELSAVKEYIDKARNGIYGFPETSRMNRLKALFALESKYYSRLGQHDREAECLDSALLAAERYEQLTGEHIIFQGERKLKEAEMQLGREKIARQKLLIQLALFALTVVVAAMVIVIRYYRKRNAAYKALAQKAKEWARDTASRIDHIDIFSDYSW